MAVRPPPSPARSRRTRRRRPPGGSCAGPSRRARTPAGRRSRAADGGSAGGKAQCPRPLLAKACVEALLGRGPLVVLRPDPLRVGGEALVEPHVLPGLRGDGVAEPLVGQSRGRGVRCRAAPGKTGLVWVSRAYPTSLRRSTIAPVEEKGYGPKFSSAHSMISGIRREHARALAAGHGRVDGGEDRQAGRRVRERLHVVARRWRGGEIARHRLGVVPGEGGAAAAWCAALVNSPLEMACSPSGTVTVMSYEALSLGWWLPGNQAIDPSARRARPRRPPSSASLPRSRPRSVIVSGAPE